MHSCSIQIGDTWLAGAVTMIANAQAFQRGGALFITWDEGAVCEARDFRGGKTHRGGEAQRGCG